MRMIPGWHLDWNTFEMVELPAGTFEKWNADRSKLFGTCWFWMQMLHGDTADNIPGLPRLDGKPVGPVRAEKLLSNTLGDDAAYVMVSNSYAFEYGDEWTDRFVEQAMLLWMRQDPGAHHHNFMAVIPETFRAELWPAVHKVTQRIKDAYAEAQKLGGLGVQEDRA
jgi:DNA polymerase-1